MINRAPVCLLVVCTVACVVPNPVVTVKPDRLLADGYDTAILSTRAAGSSPPHITLVRGPYGTILQEISGGARIRTGVVPGAIAARVEFPGSPAQTVELASTLDTRDRAEDGTPDFLRLDQQRDRITFRRWLTYLAEVQYFQPPAARPAEIDDCAALIRYGYREALRRHDGAWAQEAKLAVVPALGSIEKYDYPHTPLNANLFRVRAGPFRASDLADGAFLQFADAKTLFRFNTHVISRNLAAAQPGDILFFRQETDHMTYHSMIYLGASQLRPDGLRYVLYHTGPDAGDPGELRRLPVEQIKRFPQPEWRPVETNPSFLGVARWNILRTGADASDVEQD